MFVSPTQPLTVELDVQGKAKYKKQSRDIAEAFRQTRNAYMRLRKEKGVNGTVQESALWPGRQSGGSGKLTPDLEDAEPWQGSAGSDRDLVEPAGMPTSGGSTQQRTLAGTRRELAGPASRGSRGEGSAAGKGREPAEPACPPPSTGDVQQHASAECSREPKELAGPPARCSSGLAASPQHASTRMPLPQPALEAGKGVKSLAEEAVQTRAGPATQPGPSPGPAAPDGASSTQEQQPAAVEQEQEVHPAAALPEQPSVLGRPEQPLAVVKQEEQPAGRPEDASMTEQPLGKPAAQDVQQGTASAAGTMLEPLRPMNPPPPRRHPAAAVTTIGSWAADAQAGQWQAEPLPVLPPCGPSVCDETQTQPDTFQPLHQLARTPQTRRGVKRAVPLLGLCCEPLPAPVPAKQLAFDASTAPAWGPAGGKAAGPAADRLPAGPAWKKAARASNADQRAFDIGEGQLPAGRQDQQQQGAEGPPALALVVQQQLQQLRQWQQSGGGRAAGAGASDGSSGGYKYQEVVRKRDERQKLKVRATS
jgi:hypothetical protein